MYNCLINPLQIFLHAPDPRKSSLAYIYHTVTYSIYGKDAVVTMEKKKKKRRFLKLQLKKYTGRGIKDINC